MYAHICITNIYPSDIYICKEEEEDDEAELPERRPARGLDQAAAAGTRDTN